MQVGLKANGGCSLSGFLPSQERRWGCWMARRLLAAGCPHPWIPASAGMEN